MRPAPSKFTPWCQKCYYISATEKCPRRVKAVGIINWGVKSRLDVCAAFQKCPWKKWASSSTASVFHADQHGVSTFLIGSQRVQREARGTIRRE